MKCWILLLAFVVVGAAALVALASQPEPERVATTSAQSGLPVTGQTARNGLQLESSSEQRSEVSPRDLVCESGIDVTTYTRDPGAVGPQTLPEALREFQRFEMARLPDFELVVFNTSADASEQDARLVEVSDGGSLVGQIRVVKAGDAWGLTDYAMCVGLVTGGDDVYEREATRGSRVRRAGPARRCMRI